MHPNALECIPTGSNRFQTGLNGSEHVRKRQKYCGNFEKSTESWEKIADRDIDRGALLEVNVAAAAQVSGPPGLRHLGAEATG